MSRALQSSAMRVLTAQSRNECAIRRASNRIRHRWNSNRAARASGEDETAPAMDLMTTTTTTVETSSSSSSSTDENEYELVGNLEPRRFAVAEGQALSLVFSSLPATTRLVSGVLTHGYKVELVKGSPAKGEYAFGTFSGYYPKETSKVSEFKRPVKALKLYEFEGCPFCRKVREAIVWLDLDPIVYPCPRDGKIYREFVKEKGGKAQFPYLIDENMNVAMYESDDIIEYLYENYGPGKDKVPSWISRSPLVTVSASIGMLARMSKGSKLDKNALTIADDGKEIEPIVFYGYETSPFCKIVRERLVELELPHQIKTCGRGSMKRNELMKKRGMFQVPYIEDPNTKKAMFESKDILEYLNKQYSSA